MEIKLQNLIDELQKNSDSERAKNLSWFFKTGKGQYGEGDVFIGITVPILRAISKKYQVLELKDLQKLLGSEIHEHRLSALMILRFKYENKKSDQKSRKDIVDFYLKNTKIINNWDLVDLSCHYILGNYLLDKDRSILYKLAKSENLWEKRISIISTFAFIRNNDFVDALKLSEILLKDKHDLIHKGVGWVLREVGKKDKKIEIDFLNKHYKAMPRTALRYAIEKFSDTERKYYLSK
jgi:3-methyladenine DNA glycosylase AlkD